MSNKKHDGANKPLSEERWEIPWDLDCFVKIGEWGLTQRWVLSYL